MAQASTQSTPVSTEISISATDPRLNWLMLWSLSPTGECCCPSGSTHLDRRGRAIGRTMPCSGGGAGKHPWMVRKNGKLVGYVHGSKDADVSQEAAQEKYGQLGGARRWAITLKDLVLIDLDSIESLQAFRRMAAHIPAEKTLGVAKTVRGWHIYIDCPGFSQRALNLYMRRWLDDWHGTDRTKISRRGFLMDVRTGDNRYAVWPEIDRRWASAAELVDNMRSVAGPMPTHRMVLDGSKAPWNLVRTPELEAEITAIGESVARINVVHNSDGSLHKGYALSELTRWCQRLAAMPADSGRNNMLNKVAYFSGARAIRAGMDPDRVRQALRDAAYACGLEPAETDLTIESGLRGGAASLTRTA